MYAVGISVSRAPPWFSILAPKGTPAPIIEKLNRAVEPSPRRPEDSRWIRDQGVRHARSAVARPRNLAPFCDHSRSFGTRPLRPPECIQANFEKR